MKGLFSICSLLLFIVACTGQKPAPIKNSTISKSPIAPACSSLKFSGAVLTKENMSKIFSCSGWEKIYPHLAIQISTGLADKINNVLAPLNQQFFASKADREKLFNFMEEAQMSGRLSQLSRFLEKGLSQQALPTQLGRIMAIGLEKEELRKIFKLLSVDNSHNIKNLKSLGNLVRAYQNYRPDINKFLTPDRDVDFHERMVALADDVVKLEHHEWKMISRILEDHGSPLKSWASDGLTHDILPFLRVVQNPAFVKDVKYLNNSLQTGIGCSNSANARKFTVNVKQELKHTIDSLKKDKVEDFELLILHSLTKYIAFHDFCEEKEQQQGLRSFANILNYTSEIVPSQHDFTFLQRLHNIFGKERFSLVSFLASDNFTKWNELLNLLKKKDFDVGLVRTLYSVISDIGDEDLKVLAVWISELENPESQTSQWFIAWSKIWNKLSFNEKNEFIKLLSTVAEEDLDLESIVSMSADLMNQFPIFSQSLLASLENHQYQEDLFYLVKLLSSPQGQSDLSRFFAGEGLFEFLKILTANNSKVIPTPDLVPAPIHTYVMMPLIENRPSQASECFTSMSIFHDRNPSYHLLVNELPEVCLGVLEKVGFVGRIYLWMHHSNNYFMEERGINDYHSRLGVWSPAMLQFIFTAAIQVDVTLQSAKGGGLLTNLDAIHETVTSPEVLESLHLGSLLFLDISQKIPLEVRLDKLFGRLSNKELNDWSKSFFTLSNKDFVHRFNVPSLPTSCKDLDQDLGVSTCLSSHHLSGKVIDLLRLMKRKNQNNESLIQELLRWVHPQGGTSLPLLTKKHIVSLEDVIRFTHDLTAQSTSEEFYYNDGESIKKVTGTTIDRLEVVIREIAFSNNFYGAYFKNKVAGFQNYPQEMHQSRKLLNWLDRLGSIMRKTKALPADSRWRLDNVRNTFESLLEVSDQFKQTDGTHRSYGDFIQSLLATISKSSRIETQDFNGYRVPQKQLVEGHNGIFLTKVVELSGLRHLGRFVRSRLNDLSILETAEFKQVNQNLLGRHSLPLLQANFQRVLDTYLDSDSRQINLMVEDLISYIATLDYHQQQKLESVLLKAVLMLSDKNISEAHIHQAGQAFEIIVKQWPVIRIILKQINEPELILNEVNKFLERIIQDDSQKSFIAYLSEAQLISLSEMEALLTTPEFRTHLVEFAKHYLRLKVDSNGLNWGVTMKAIFASPDMSWAPLKNWLSHSLLPATSKNLTLSVLLQTLGEKKNDNYRFKMLMDELLINYRGELNQFLKETLPSLELKSE